MAEADRLRAKVVTVNGKQVEGFVNGKGVAFAESASPDSLFRAYARKCRQEAPETQPTSHTDSERSSPPRTATPESDKGTT